MNNQQGSVLLLSLVFLTLIAWLTLSLLESSLFLSRLFAQQQQKSADLLQAENYLNAILLENKAQWQIKRESGYRSCASHWDSACDDNRLQLSAELPSDLQLFYYADYQGDDAQRAYWQLTLHYHHNSPLVLAVDISVALEQQIAGTHHSSPQGEWRFY